MTVGNLEETYPYTDGSIHEEFGAYAIYPLGVPAQPLTQYHIFEVTSQSNNCWSAWINGILLYQSDTNAFGLPSQFLVATYNNGGSSYNFGGDIPEVLIFNRGLTVGERTMVNSYLNGKYALVPFIPATPSNLMATAISASQIGLTWSEPLNGGATQTSIERSTNSGSGFAVVAQLADALSYVDTTNLAAGTAYYYRARAMNVNTWSPYSNQTNATTLASAADIPFANLVLWLKADSGLAQIGTNTPVSFWADQSGNGNNVIQESASFSAPTATFRPTWVSGTIGGFPVVHYNAATNQTLFTYDPMTGNHGVLNGMGGATGVEAFAVVRVTTTPPATAEGLWYFGDVTGSANEQYPGTNGVVSDNFGSTTVHAFTPTNVVLTNYNVYEVTSQSNNWTAWINGVSQYYTNSNTVGFGIPFYIGNPNNNFDGDVAEVLIFNQALSPTQRATVITNYLFSKYGIPH